MAFNCCAYFGVKTDGEKITSGSIRVSHGPRSKKQSKDNFSMLKFRR